MASNTKKVTGTGITTDSGKYTSSIWTESSTAGNNVFAIQDSTVSTKLKLTGKSGDVVMIEGFSSDYEVKLIGTVLTLISEEQKLVVTMARDSKVTFAFLDGSAVVDLSQKVKMFGDQKLTAIRSQLLATVSDTTPESKAAEDHFTTTDVITPPVVITPPSPPTYVLTNDTILNGISEGQTATFTLSTTNVVPGTTFSYALSGISTSDILGGSMSGIATIDSTGKAVVSVSLLEDQKTEGVESLKVNFPGVVFTGQSLTSQVISIADSSLTPPPPPTPPVKLTLSTGVDNLVGSVNDDIINNVDGSATLTNFDSVDGGAGSDTLNYIQTSTIPSLTGVKIVNVENINLSSSGNVTLDASTFTGLLNLNSTSVGSVNISSLPTTNVTVNTSSLSAGSISVDGGNDLNITATGTSTGGIVVGDLTSATGIITIKDISSTSIGTATMGNIITNGGKVVSITQTAKNAYNTTATLGDIIVNGGEHTSAVSISNSTEVLKSQTVAGVTAGNVTIVDSHAGDLTKVGTISTIAVDGFKVLTIKDTALSTLNLANGVSNITIDNSGLTTPTTQLLNLGVNGLKGGILDDSNVYTILDITTNGADSTFANVTFGGALSLSISGNKNLILTSAAGLTSLKSVTVYDSAGISADFSSLPILTISTSNSTGKSTITLDGSVTSFTGGNGIDLVTSSATTNSKSIVLGSGDDSLIITNGTTIPTLVDGGVGTDIISLTASLAGTVSLASTTPITNFEKLILSSATNQTVDISKFGVVDTVTTSGGVGLTLNNILNNSTLLLNSSGTAYTVSNSAFTTGISDTLKLTLTDGSNVGVSFASTGITAANVENLLITTVDSQTTPTGAFLDSLTLIGNDVKTISISGNAGLDLTSTSTSLSNVDASGIKLGGFNWTTGVLSSAATISGSSTGTNTVDFSLALGNVTYIGGTKNDTIVASNGKNNVISLGDGTNTVTATTGNNTIVGGSEADAVTVTTGNNTVNLGNGTNTFTATTGNNVYAGGSGVDTISVGSGLNVLTVGSGSDVVTITTAGQNVGTYTTITDPHTALKITAIDKGVETFGTTKVSLAGTATFSDYVGATIQNGGDASTNGYFGWFQFNGDTFIVESMHNGTTTPNYVAGVDLIVKLSGVVDLSTATLSGNSLII